MADKKTSAFTAITRAATGDYIPLLDTSASELKKILFSDFRDSLGSSKWTEIATSKYTTTPTNTYTLAMFDTSDVAVGMPLKYTISATNYYGIITALSANTSITVAGASLSADVTNLYVGQPGGIEVVRLVLPGDFDNGIDATNLATEGQAYEWLMADAYLVYWDALAKGDDTGAANAKVNLNIGGSAVSSLDSNNGIQVATSWAGHATTSLVAISTSNYKAEWGDDIEVNVTAAGSNGDGTDLNIMAVFVYE